MRSASLFVEAPARLHFGMLDLRGELGRRYGGIGAAVPTPSLLLEIGAHDSLRVEGPPAESERVREFVRRFAVYHKLEALPRVRICLHRTIPAHVGLGSGTQLALAVARGLAELLGLDTAPAQLARAVDRGRRSAVGTWTFALGGFVLEGGREGEGREESVAPLLAHFAMPPAWRCVIAVPEAAPGLVGEHEAAAFAELPAPCKEEVERVAHLVLLQLLPALAEAEITGFGAALTEIQRITGGWFAGAQGGVFARGPSGALVRALRSAGAAGVGQSSWGPAVYGLAQDQAAAADLARAAQAVLGATGAVYNVGFATQGAQVFSQAPAGGAKI